MLISSFLLRPSSFGQEYTNIALILLAAAFVLYLMRIGFKKQKIRFTKKNIVIFVVFTIFWLYILVQGITLSVEKIDWVIKAVIAHLSSMFIFFILLSDPKVNKFYFKGLIIILLLNSLSYILTIVLILFGFDMNELYFLRTYVDTDIYYQFTHYGRVLFPFTQIYGRVFINNLEIPRALGFFREAGIYQMFLIFSIFNSNRYFKKHLKLINSILIIGVMSTFSTAGLVLLVVIFALKLFMEKKYSPSFATIVFSFIAFLFAPIVGFQDKSNTSVQSFDDRINSFYEGIDLLIKNPFGVGLYNAIDSTNRNLGIHLIGMSSMIGIIGLILILLVYFLPIVNYNNKKLYIISIAPFFLTLLTSQPILDAPLVYVMFLCNFAVNYVNDSNKMDEIYSKAYFTLI